MTLNLPDVRGGIRLVQQKIDRAIEAYTVNDRHKLALELALAKTDAAYLAALLPEEDPTA